MRKTLIGRRVDAYRWTLVDVVGDEPLNVQARNFFGDDEPYEVMYADQFHESNVLLSEYAEYEEALPKSVEKPKFGGVL